MLEKPSNELHRRQCHLFPNTGLTIFVLEGYRLAVVFEEHLSATEELDFYSVVPFLFSDLSVDFGRLTSWCRECGGEFEREYGAREEQGCQAEREVSCHSFLRLEFRPRSSSSNHNDHASGDLS